MAAVHVAMGAACGGVTGSAWAGMAVGLASHAVGDMVPHREAGHVLDSLLTALALAGVAVTFGVLSPQMAGAVGGALPDVEHVLKRLRLRPWKKAIYPTHNRLLPHPHSSSYLSQICCGVASVAALVAQRLPI